MNTTLLYPKAHIYLFQNSDNPNDPQLKNVINFLKWKTLKQIVKFDHVSENGNLIEELSIHDNLTLESREFCRYRKIPKDINKTLIQNIGESISPILKEFPNWDTPINQLNQKQRKLASIIKSLNLSHPFVILENPEKHLDEALIENLKVVFNEIIQDNANELIFSNTSEIGIWSDLFTKKVTYQKNKLFLIDDFKAPYVQDQEVSNSDKDDTKLAA
jgi:ABC-type multidrug transport system ATPase subunit